MAFTADQLSRLAGISTSRLRYWEATDAFISERSDKLVTGPYSKFYTFQDLVSLRVMARLRNEFGVDLQDLRNVSLYLREHSDQPWSSLAVRVNGKKLEFREPVTGEWVSANPVGQMMLEIEFSEVSAEAEVEARNAMLRHPDSHGQVTRNRNVMGNQPVFAGTRIPVATVIRLLEAQYTNADILRCYPTLSPADIKAAQLLSEEKHDAA